MLLKYCTQYASKFGKLSNGHRTGKGQFSFQSQRKTMPKNVQTTAQLYSFHMLSRQCSKSFKLGFNSSWTKNIHMYKLVLEKAEKPDIKLSTSIGSQKKQEKSRNPEKHLQPLTVWITRNYGKFLKRWKHQTTVCVSWETCNSYNQTWNNQLVQNWERSTTSILSLCLSNSMQSTSAFLTSMLGWRKLKLESRL